MIDQEWVAGRFQSSAGKEGSDFHGLGSLYPEHLWSLFNHLELLLSKEGSKYLLF